MDWLFAECKTVRKFGLSVWIKVLPLSSIFFLKKSSVYAMLENKDSYLILTCLVSALIWVLLWICTNKTRCGFSIHTVTHLPSAEDQREDSSLGYGDFHWKLDGLFCIWCTFCVVYETDEAGLSCKHRGNWKTEELLMGVLSLILVEY